MLKWNAQRGVVVIPKAQTPANFQANFEGFFDWSLTEEQKVKLRLCCSGVSACTIALHEALDPASGWSEATQASCMQTAFWEQLFWPASTIPMKAAWWPFAHHADLTDMRAVRCRESWMRWTRTLARWTQNGSTLTRRPLSSRACRPFPSYRPVFGSGGLTCMPGGGESLVICRLQGIVRLALALRALVADLSAGHMLLLPFLKKYSLGVLLWSAWNPLHLSGQLQDASLGSTPLFSSLQIHWIAVLQDDSP